MAVLASSQNANPHPSASRCAAWAPLEPAPGPYAGLILVAVLIQELARLGIWRFHRCAPAGITMLPAAACLLLSSLLHLSPQGPPSTAPTIPKHHFRLSVRVLNRIAAEQRDAPVSTSDRFGLALAYGFSHGAVHSAFFCLAWLPLSLGDGTIYVAHCPRMSYYLVAALSTLGMAALLTGAMVLAFDAAERRQGKHAALAPAAHAAAALLTLLNFAEGGCMVSVPLLLAGGTGVAAAAMWVWWQRTTSVPRLAVGRRLSEGAAGGNSSGGGNDRHR